MTALRIARWTLLVAIAAYAAAFAGMSFGLINADLALLLGLSAGFAMAVTSVAALSLQLWSGIRRKR